MNDVVATLRDVPEPMAFSVYFLTRNDRVIDEQPFVDVRMARQYYDREIQRRNARNDDGWVCLFNRKDGSLLEYRRITPSLPWLVDELNHRFGHRV